MTTRKEPPPIPVARSALAGRRLQRNQRGVALLIFLVLLVMGGLTYLVNSFSPAEIEAKRQRKTEAALAQAKDALIGYAVSVDISTTRRPGDLPCPDRDNDGKAGTTIPLVTSCGNAAGTTFQDRRLGRLPWKDLGLPDLQDASDERLWYAVSNNFKENTRTALLNSDTTGTITVRDTSGNIDFDGSGTTGAVAVIIAPGPPLMRQDGLQQNRSVGNINDPQHYLDNIAVEDNADFDEIVNKTNGFFIGPVRNSSGSVIANDRIIVITRDEIIAAIEKRVVAEVRNCLTNYADLPINAGRYPWAASLAASASGNYGDTPNTRFGRVPNLLCNTAGDGTGACLGTTGTNPAMLSTWGAVPNCHVTSAWFASWREQVFYAIADAYKPGTGGPSCGTCLTIDATGNKQVATFISGKRVSGQNRTTPAEKAQIAQYLEGENNNLDDAFVTKPLSSTFNDRVLYR